MAKKTETYEFSLPKSLVEDLLSALKERDLDLSTAIRLQLRALQAELNLRTPLTTKDRMRFGKYAGESIHNVIHFDPYYIQWCKSSIEGFCLDEEATELYKEEIDAR